MKGALICGQFVYLDCSCVAMAWNYVKISMFGTAAAYSRDDEIMAAVAVLTQTPQKRPWGGSVPGHKTYKRDRITADWQLNQDYFVERPLYNEEHLRRRYNIWPRFNFHDTLN